MTTKPSTSPAPDALVARLKRTEVPPGTPHDATDLGPGTALMLSVYRVDPGHRLASLTGA